MKLTPEEQKIFEQLVLSLPLSRRKDSGDLLHKLCKGFGIKRDLTLDQRIADHNPKYLISYWSSEKRKKTPVTLHQPADLLGIRPQSLAMYISKNNGKYSRMVDNEGQEDIATVERQNR